MVPPMAVAQQEQRFAGMGVAQPFQQPLQVVNIVIEGPNPKSFTRRRPMTAQIGRIDGQSAAGQRLGQAGIPSAVLANAVNKDHDAPRLAGSRQPATIEQLQPLGHRVMRLQAKGLGFFGFWRHRLRGRDVRRGELRIPHSATMHVPQARAGSDQISWRGRSHTLSS